MRTVPQWINQDISPADIAAINQGGCESGAYMPAVSYYQARETMSEHGDDVTDYLIDHLGELPTPDDSVDDWSRLAVFYLSQAVELWAAMQIDAADPYNCQPLRSLPACVE